MSIDEMRNDFARLCLNTGMDANNYNAWWGFRNAWQTARAPVSIKEGAEAVKAVFDLSLVGPDSGFKPEDVAGAIAKRWKLPYVE